MTLESHEPQVHDVQAHAPRERVRWGAIALFVAIAYGLAWLVTIPVWRIDRDSAGLAEQLLSQLLAQAMMFTPAIATLVVMFALRAPKGERLRFLGIWPLRPAKRVIWFIVIGWFGPTILIVLALALSVLLGWFTPDLEHLSGFSATLAAAGAQVADPHTLFWIQLATIPLAGILNLVPSFGEELGWRGWLLPALRPLGTWPALLVSGAIWGVWHAPLTFLGHNFGLYDWRGVALMTVGCIVWGTFLGWLRLRSASLWPAVLAHGAMNGTAGLFMLISSVDAAPNLVLVNPLGVSGWIIVGLAVAILAVAGQFARQPSLAPRRVVAPPQVQAPETPMS